MAMLEWFRRLFAPRIVPGVGYGGAVAGVKQDYSPEHALSAIAAFPAVNACIRVIASDLAGLPLIQVKRSGALEVPIGDSPQLRLLRRPNSRCSGLRYRRQVVADFLATGNSYTERPSPNLLYRAHPEMVSAIVESGSGRETAWKFAQRTIPLEQMMHVADISWTTSLTMLYGESPIRSLERQFSSVTAAQDNMLSQTKRGRPTVVFTGSNEGEPLGDDSVRRITAAWNEFTRRKEDAFVVGHGLKADFLNLSPREMEFSSAEERSIAMTLMVMGVPPARVFWGGGSAYGTDRQAMRTYWEGILKGPGALFAEEWTHFLLGADGAADADRIEHDTSNIEALAVNRTEALTRVERWATILGGDVAAAARYEGFRGAPTGDISGSTSRPIDRQPEEPQDDRVRAHLAPIPPTAAELLGEYLAGAAERYQRRVLDADGHLEALTDGRHRDEEAIRALVVLERLGVDAAPAVELAHTIATQTDDAVASVASDAWSRGVTRVGLGTLAAFGPRRAERIAGTLQRLESVA